MGERLGGRALLWLEHSVLSAMCPSSRCSSTFLSSFFLSSLWLSVSHCSVCCICSYHAYLIPVPPSYEGPGYFLWVSASPYSVLGICGLGQREVPTDLILLKFICCKGYSRAETETHSNILCPLYISFYSSKLRGEVLTHHLHSDSRTLPSGLG